MLESFQKIEYKEIICNYTKYDYLKPLIKKIELIDNIPTTPYLKIMWIEQIFENVFVDDEGWYVDENMKYPTFESLAMQRSKGFFNNWGEALNKRILQLDNQENDYNN
ncbi:hypothetical protein C6P40_004826 [Pichia californica]|uniref:Uncharacterized protein n=1 Tax=Pichia californica TaxID=460514 RepID=A0A9P6WLZ1_9ASCO|nr:hypothetical protein C6P42_003435 [[Candida] californica]KAG0689571.1 hypothetical protein C6P40_004826 [[Candida] californica]